MSSRILILALLVVALLAILTGRGESHEWYDGWCCNNKDCRPAKVGELQFNNKGVIFLPTGKQFVWGEDNLKPSQDGEAHVCLMVNGEARCVYYAIGG